MAISAKIKKNLTSASLIRRVADEGARMRKDGLGEVLDLSLGNPTIEPPAAFYTQLQRQLQSPSSGGHRYMNNNGYPEVRAALAAHLKGHFGLPFTQNHVSLNVGAAGAGNTVLKALLDPGDEVIILSPYFVEYTFYIDNHGGVPVIVPSQDDFQLDLAALEAALTPRTKVLLLSTPNNPTGVVYSDEKLAALGELLRAHRQRHNRVVYVINDTPYRRLLYELERAPEPLLHYEHSVLVTSFSKDLAIPGERIGYAAFSPGCEDIELMMEAMAFSSRVLGFVNAPALMQHVLPHLLDESVDMSWYRRKRDLLIQGLQKAGYELVVPQGAFYLFPKAPGGDDVAFYNALKEHRVLVVPGSGFGTPGYFRIAYCCEDAVVEKALPILQEVGARLH